MNHYSQGDHVENKRPGGQVRAFLAMSLDGFIAGTDDDLSWLPVSDLPGPGAIDLEHFLADVGAMLMGRRTYDVVAGFDAWAYGETPILVPTHRPLDPMRSTVQPASGEISELIERALAIADGKDVYVDGGDVVQQALDADRLDELILTVVPIVLGSGVPLFGALRKRLDFTFAPPTSYGSMIQLRATRSRPTM